MSNRSIESIESDEESELIECEYVDKVKKYKKIVIVLLIFISFIIFVFINCGIYIGLKYHNYKNIVQDYENNIIYKTNCNSLKGGYYSNGTNCLPYTPSTALRWTIYNYSGLGCSLTSNIFNYGCNTIISNNPFLYINNDTNTIISWNDYTLLIGESFPDIYCYTSLFPFMNIKITIGELNYICFNLPGVKPNNLVQIYIYDNSVSVNINGIDTLLSHFGVPCSNILM